MMPRILVLLAVLSCFGVGGYYISSLIEQRAVLEQNLLTANAASKGYQKTIETLDREMKASQDRLIKRERSRAEASKLAIMLQKRLDAELSKDEKQCYEKVAVPDLVIDSIISRLQPVPANSGSASAGNKVPLPKPSVLPGGYLPDPGKGDELPGSD